jgi:hypothetical protein
MGANFPYYGIILAKNSPENFRTSMNDSISFDEQILPTYKTGSYLALILSAICFIIFWNISSVFWVGIFRLSSFIFFTVAVLGYLKLMNRPLKITLEISSDLLRVVYRKRGEVIQEEDFDRATIREIILVPANSLISRIYKQDSKTFEIHFTDTTNKLYLFEFGGRPLHFESGTVKRISSFIQNKNIKV